MPPFRTDELLSRGRALLQGMLGPEAAFRPNQWEAIEALASHRRRVLVVERTGWGKSIVYFLAAKLLREQGAGPALLVSPLLSLMRNQISMAERIGVRALTIHSGNREEWETVESALAADQCDILLISPERLSNERFLSSVLASVGGRVGMLVVDEAHCISDWGHDFRPDYRRIGRIIENLPKGVPLLATTATANDRVTADVTRLLGENLLLIRGPLARASLRLQNLVLGDQPSRLAWIAENIRKFKGSGIIYCLTIADTERVAKWLQSKEIDARSYHAGQQTREREQLEKALIENRLKALVATVALGMGFDKADLGFIVHFQRPGSVIAYYQQVGRAGRGVDRAYGILLTGTEDDEIQEYFIDRAFPKVEVLRQVVALLARSEGLATDELLQQVNVSRGTLETALKLLEVDGAIGIDRTTSRARYFRTLQPWQPAIERMQRITALRRAEFAEMRQYARHPGCLMEFLARALDDSQARPCGVCANCQAKGFVATADPDLVADAVAFLNGQELTFEPRRMWPAGLFPELKRKIAAEHLVEAGRILSTYGDCGWGQAVKIGKYTAAAFGDDLVQAAADLVHQRWKPHPFPEWVTAVPSPRRPALVHDFAVRCAAKLGLPFAVTLRCEAHMPEQKLQANSFRQATNVAAMLGIDASAIRPGPVLLLDDMIDSGWTMTIAGWLLRSHGSGPVYPFALSRSTPRNA